MATANAHINRWRLLGSRRAVMLLITAAGVWSFFYLELSPKQLWPDTQRWDRISEFFGAALSPAFSYETPIPGDDSSLLYRVAAALLTTVIFAIAAASMSVIIGIILAFFGSTAWWTNDPVGGLGPVRKMLQKTVRPTFFTIARILIALSRSTHELLWAVLFLVAFGMVDIVAVLAIVIPYSGTLAKVFSEMIDESPRDAAKALRASGATPVQVFAFGLLPRALPDMAAYSLYRFECALRSSAIVGFFGFPTLGYFIKESFTARHDHEVWTYLYALIIMVILIDWWSGTLRRRLTA
jgi:phosphonate transport system permease protein